MKNLILILNKAKFFAGHSLGEYSALACADYLNFSDTIKILKKEVKQCKILFPKGEGGMLAVLGSKLGQLKNIFEENKKNFQLKLQMIILKVN